MNLRFVLFASALLAGSADGRLTGEKDVGAKEFMLTPTTLGNESYTGTFAMVNTNGPNLGLSILLLTCVEGTCEGVQRLNVPGSLVGTPGRFVSPPLESSAVIDVGRDGRGKCIITPPAAFGGVPLEVNISPQQLQGNLVTKWIGSPDGLNPFLAPNRQTSVLSATRRAADGYSNQSLNGVYAWSSVAGLHQGVYYGFATFDGEGGFTGILTSDEPDPEAETGRAITEGPLLGTYEVTDNGFVTMAQTGPGAPMNALFFTVTEGPPDRVDALRGSWDSAPTNQFIASDGVTAVDLIYYEPGTSIDAPTKKPTTPPPTSKATEVPTSGSTLKMTTAPTFLT